MLKEKKIIGFIAFLAVGLCLIGAKFYPSRLKFYENLGEYERINGDLTASPIGYYEQVTVENMRAEEFISQLNGKVLFTEKAGDRVIYYCYSPEIYKRNIINGKKVNLVVAEADYGIVVGSPMLIGSF